MLRDSAPRCCNQDSVEDTSGNGVGFPAVIGDRLPDHLDFSTGNRYDSKSQREKDYKEKGLVMHSSESLGPKFSESKRRMTFDQGANHVR